MDGEYVTLRFGSLNVDQMDLLRRCLKSRENRPHTSYVGEETLGGYMKLFPNATVVLNEDSGEIERYEDVTLKLVTKDTLVGRPSRAEPFEDREILVGGLAKLLPDLLTEPTTRK